MVMRVVGDGWWVWGYYDHYLFISQLSSAEERENKFVIKQNNNNYLTILWYLPNIKSFPYEIPTRGFDGFWKVFSSPYVECTGDL